jgi:hypothetical protein
VKWIPTHLGGDVLIKVARILSVSELRFEGRLYPVDVVPVDSFEPHMSLHTSWTVARCPKLPVVVIATAVDDRSRHQAQQKTPQSPHDELPCNQYGIDARAPVIPWWVMIVIAIAIMVVEDECEDEQVKERTSQDSSASCLGST